MIRRIARIEAPPEMVRDMFRDTDLWPEWMPGVTSTRTLEQSGERRSVEVVQLQLGRRFVQRLECRERDGGLRHRQIAGALKKWEADWTFHSPPDGDGTTISLRLDLELGFLGFLVPKAVLRRWIRGLLDDTFERAGARARLLAARRPRQPTVAVRVGEPVLQVFETASGFEVRFAGRTFHVEAD